MEWYLGVLKKYADFSGRARRKEYWMFVLVNLLIGAVLNLLATFTNLYFFSVISGIYGLAVLIPHIAVAVRRLHDIGKSGVWFLVVFIPFIGWIWFIILMATEGVAGSNEYGEDPKV